MSTRHRHDAQMYMQTNYRASFPHPSVPSPSLRVPGAPAALPPPRLEPGPQGAL